MLSRKLYLASQESLIKLLILRLANICFIGSELQVKFNHYLALAHSALTSFSLMSSQRLSCSICRSRSLMSPIVTHIGRAAHTLRTHTPVTLRTRKDNTLPSNVADRCTPSDKDRAPQHLQLLARGMCRIETVGTVGIEITILQQKLLKSH